eukprot:7925483-Ditylum_brightwellii.AAC.1
MLPQMGYSRTFPYAVVFGSKFSGGLGFTQIMVAQLSAKICRVVKHVSTNTKTGQKFIASTRWQQLSAGVGTPILEETRSLPYMEGKWLSTLLQEMRQVKCTIHMVNMWVPHKKREHDQYIMDVVINNPRVEEKDLDPIN